MEIEPEEPEETATTGGRRKRSRGFEMTELRESLDQMAEYKRGKFPLPFSVQIKTVSGLAFLLEFPFADITIRHVKYLLWHEHGLRDFKLLAKQDAKSVPVTELDDLAIPPNSVLYLMPRLTCRAVQ